MALSPHVFDASTESSPRLVLENSPRGRLRVHFWTPKAGPCLLLMPRLVKLATEYGGRFLLVMANTDEPGAAVRRSPACPRSPSSAAARWWKPCPAPSRTSTSVLLDRFILRDSANLYAQGLALQKNETEDAKSLLAAAAVEDPANPAIPRDLARLLWAVGEHAQALRLLESLPAKLRPHEQPICTRTFAWLLPRKPRRRERGHRPSTRRMPKARLRLGARQLAQDDRAAALEARTSLDADLPQYRSGLPRLALLALFDLRGSEHPLTRQYRAKLSRRLT